MSFQDLTAEQRLVATHIAFMKDPWFCRLGGITQVGENKICSIPTAATNGIDKMYGEEFIMGLSKEQLRFVVAHECLHIAYHHCTEYAALVKKYPRLSNMAMDYVVNRDILIMDDGRGFVAVTTDPAPLLDDKYKEHSWLEVLQDLLQGENSPGKGGGQPGEGTLDEHIQSAPGTVSEEVAQQIADAVKQGQMLSDKMRGEGKGGRPLGGYVERKTDWRKPLRQFISDICVGDEHSRFNPPNRRMLPLGIVMPSHYAETTGCLVIAADTSGSMDSVIGVLLGEIAQICQQALPDEVHVVFWDTEICSEHKFTAKDYSSMAKLCKPAGGGGTTASVVADWVTRKGIKPKATIILTDGYIEPRPRLPEGPVLWGVVDNSRWVPPRGKALHLSSLDM